MFLVLCDPQDLPALWAFDLLQRRLGSEVRLVSTGLLAAALLWEHELSRDGVNFRLRLTDGTEIKSEEIDGVLNRLIDAPTPHWSQSDATDRLYVQQEMTAFYLSWLHSLRCPMYNPPTPQGLSGRWRHESEWAMLAAQAGLPTPTYEQSTRNKNETVGTLRLRSPAAHVHTAIVLDRGVFGFPLPAELRRRSVELAASAEAPLLAVEFIRNADGSLVFAGATPRPDLRLGGRELIDQLQSAWLAHAA